MSIYTDFVASRFKTGEAITADIATGELSNALSRLHAVIGILTELHEYFHSTEEENAIEELGDIHFYLTALEQHSTPDLGTASESANVDPVQAALALLGLCKKEVMYAKELSISEISEFIVLQQALRRFYRKALATEEVTGAEVEAHNIAKLEKRYPTGYSNSAAQARADKTEGE